MRRRWKRKGVRPMGSEIRTSVLNRLIPFVLGSAGGAAALWFGCFRALCDGVQCLERAEIVRRNEMWIRERYCPLHAEETLMSEYKAYHGSKVTMRQRGCIPRGWNCPRGRKGRRNNMKINWTVRAKNKTFWLSLIPTTLLLLQQLGALFGVALELTGVAEQLAAIVGTVFALLALLGVVTDPTTEGVSDSKQALTYGEPKGGGKADG